LLWIRVIELHYLSCMAKSIPFQNGYVDFLLKGRLPLLLFKKSQIGLSKIKGVIMVETTYVRIIPTIPLSILLLPTRHLGI